MAVRYRDLATAELGRRGSRVFYKKTRKTDGTSPGMDVSLVYEMIGRPQQSNNGTSVAFNSTLLLFNPAWFVGALTFSFEAQVANKSLVNDYTITIQNKDTLAVIGTIVVPANTGPGAGESVWLSAPAPFVPPAGDVKYQMVLPITAEDNALQVYLLRVRAHGRMIAGMIQFPMLGIGGGINEQDLVFGDSRFTFGDTGYLVETSSGIFFKELGAWATVDRWRWESVSGNTGFLGVPQNYIALCPKGTTSVIVQNIHLTTFSATDLISTDFADNAGFFANNGEFVVVSREDAGGGASNDLLLKANLYVHVKNLTKASAYFTVNPATRMPIAAADFSDVAGAAFEVSGYETVPGVQTCELTTSVSPSTNGAEVVVPGTQIDPNNAANTRYRVSGFGNPAGNLYYNSRNSGAGLQIKYDFLILLLKK